MTILRGNPLASDRRRRATGRESQPHGDDADLQAGATQQPPPWMLLCPPGTVLVTAPRGHRVLSRLPSGSPVAVSDNRPGSRWRLRRLARRGGLAVERELILLPTIRQPIVVLDDEESAVRHFWSSVATVPPGLVVSAIPAAVMLRVARALPWTWTGAVSPGRVLVGRRR